MSKVIKSNTYNFSWKKADIPSEIKGKVTCSSYAESYSNNAKIFFLTEQQYHKALRGELILFKHEYIKGTKNPKRYSGVKPFFYIPSDKAKNYKEVDTEAFDCNSSHKEWGITRYIKEENCQERDILSLHQYCYNKKYPEVAAANAQEARRKSNLRREKSNVLSAIRHYSKLLETAKTNLERQIVLLDYINIEDFTEEDLEIVTTNMFISKEVKKNIISKYYNSQAEKLVSTL